VTRTLAALGFVAVLSGCTVVGSGSGWLSGSVFLPQCSLDAAAGDGGTGGTALSVPLRYFFGDVVGDRIDIRMQSSGAFLDVADGLVISVRNRHDVVAAIATGGSVTVPVYAELPPQPLTGPDLAARISLYLNWSCHDTYVDFSNGTGTIIFSSMYARTADGDHADIDRIQADFAGVAFHDYRPEMAVDGALPWATIDGSFDFDYTRGRPAQPFP
jgi:hypothetical protein